MSTKFYEQYATATTANIPLKNMEESTLILKKIYSDCALCGRCKDRTSIVFGHGSYKPKIMFIGIEPSQYDAEIYAFFIINTVYSNARKKT